MAADKQFQELIAEQQKTNQLLLLDHDKRLEYDRQQALKEDAERDEAAKAAAQSQKNDKKTRSILNIISLGLLGRGGGKKRDEEQKEGFFRKKTMAVWSTKKDGINTIRDDMKDAAKKAGKGLYAVLKGTLFAGVLIAIIAFLNSQTWQDLKKQLVETVVPALANFYNKTIKPFAKGIMAFIKNRTWDNFKNIFDVEHPSGLIATLAIVTGLLAPSLLLAPLKLGIKAMGAAFSLLGTTLGGKGSAQAGAGFFGKGKKALGGIAKTFLKGARFLGPAGLIAGVGFSVFKGVKEGMDNYEKTGELSSAIKAGASKTLSTLTFGLVSPETFSDAFDWIGDKTCALTTGVKDMAVKAWNGVKNVIPTKETIADTYESLKNNAVAVTTTVGTFAKDAWTAIKDNIPSKQDIIDAIPSEEDLKVAFDQLKTDLEPLQNIKLPTEFSVSAITEALTTNATAINDAFTNITGIDVKKRFTELKDSFEYITGMEIPSFADIATGITTRITAVQNSLKNWMETSLDAIKKPLGEAKSFWEGDFLVGTRFEWMLSPNKKAELAAAEQAALEELGKGSGDGYTDAQKAALERERLRQLNLGDLDSLEPPKFMGGFLKKGQTYMINERGDEYFRPSHMGHLMNAQRTNAMRESMLRRNSGMGGGGQAVIAPTTVANTNSTNITHTTKSIVNPDSVVSTVNKAA